MATASDTPEWAYSAFSTSVDATYRTCVSGIPNDTTSLASPYILASPDNDVFHCQKGR